MSRGRGKIERAIEAAFAAEPDNAFSTEELCNRVYRGLNQVEKKHRVAVIRAGKRLVGRDPRFACLQTQGLGGQLVFFDPYNVMSYAMARLKSERPYFSNDKRRERQEDEAVLRKRLAPGGKEHRLVVEGGTYWRHVRKWIAERDGDEETVAKMDAESEKVLRALGLPTPVNSKWPLPPQPAPASGRARAAAR